MLMDVYIMTKIFNLLIIYTIAIHVLIMPSKLKGLILIIECLYSIVCYIFYRDGGSSFP